MTDVQAEAAIHKALESFDKMRKLRAALETEEKNFPQHLLTAANGRAMTIEDSIHQKLMKVLVLTLADPESDLTKSLKAEGKDKFQENMRVVFTSILLFYGEVKQGQAPENNYSFWLWVSPREVYDVRIDWANCTLKVEQLQRG
jgi:hypothetical protein